MSEVVRSLLEGHNANVEKNQRSLMTLAFMIYTHALGDHSGR
jgi:hypothetical protein